MKESDEMSCLRSIMYHDSTLLANDA